MSAYLIDSDYCITLATWAHKKRSYTPTVRVVQAAAEQIYATNVASLQARYPDSVDGLIYYGVSDIRVTDGLIQAAINLPLPVVYMAAQCAEYQSCEFTGWDDTDGGILIKRAGENAAFEWARSYLKTNQGDIGWPNIELQDSGARRLFG